MTGDVSLKQNCKFQKESYDAAEHTQHNNTASIQKYDNISQKCQLSCLRDLQLVSRVHHQATRPLLMPNIQVHIYSIVYLQLVLIM